MFKPVNLDSYIIRNIVFIENSSILYWIKTFKQGQKLIVYITRE